MSYHQFTNDYSELCHPRILTAFQNAIESQNIGYGKDSPTERAKELIKKVFKLSPTASIHLMAGGTQVNMTVISYLLKHYEGVLTVDSGHINVHETAAVEGSGHKVITVPAKNGKISAEDIHKMLKIHCEDFMVKIKMVYISNATETGSIYTKEELLSIRKECDEHNLLLFIDGARIATALTSKENDVPIELIGQVADVFYIGGTKNGALFGEAVVFKDEKMCPDFRYHIKNKGGMLAKGFVLGMMFEELFKDNLYFDLAKISNEMADYIKVELKNLKVKFDGESFTNQIFVVFDVDKAKKLIEDFGLEFWNEVNDKEWVVRIVTSFMTKKEHCEQIIEYIKKL